MAAAIPDTQREVLAQALAEHGDRLYALALRVTGDADLAADAVQEGFAAALQNAAQFRGEASLGTWLYRIVFNRSIDLLRKRSREEPLPDDLDTLSAEDLRLAHTSAGPLPDQALHGTEMRAALERALVDLTPLQRAIFELREVEGHSSEEVGTMLGLSPGAVRLHLHRARLKLRVALQSYAPEESRP